MPLPDVNLPSAPRRRLSFPAGLLVVAAAALFALGAGPAALSPRQVRRRAGR